MPDFSNDLVHLSPALSYNWLQAHILPPSNQQLMAERRKVFCVSFWSWTTIKESKWWQNFNFCLNYPFSLSL